MRLLEKGVRRIKKDTVHALDLSDIRKDFAKKMENMDRVYDGSRKEIVNGYWICEVIGAEVKGEELTPLYSKAYSQSAEDSESENKQILKAVNSVELGIRLRFSIVFKKFVEKAKRFFEVSIFKQYALVDGYNGLGFSD